MQTRAKIFLFCVLLLSNIYLAFSQKPYFRHLGVEDGLSHNTVFTIYQDHKGFMWFGTKDGLNRYDGHTFKVYKNIQGDSNSLRNNHILSFHEDGENMLWIGTNAGISIYDPILEKFNPFDTMDQNGEQVWGQILKIKEDPLGNIWIASSTAGVYRYQPNERKLIRFSHDPNRPSSLGSGSVSSLTIDDKGIVWVGILGGGVERFIPANESFLKHEKSAQILKKDLILEIFDLGGNDLLVGTKNNGLKLLNKETGGIKAILQEDHAGNKLFIRNIAKSDGQEIWISTEQGIYVYDFSQNTYKHFSQNPNDPYTLSDNATYSIYKDREGGFWIGTYFSGLNYLPNIPTNFEKFYPVINQNSIQGKRVREMVEDLDGNIWIGTEDAGLSKFNPIDKSFINFLPNKSKNSLSYHNVHGLLIDQNNLWISSHSQGLKLDKLDIRSGRFDRLDQSALQNPLFDTDIFAICKDSNNNKWYGTISGVYLMRHGENQMNFFDKLSISFYYDILEDTDGNIWFATINNGLFCYKPSSDTVIHYLTNPNDKRSLPGNAIVTLFEDSKKNLWVGSEGYGLARFDRENDAFETIDLSMGLPSNTIYKILEDDLGQLWLSTNRGLVKYNSANQKIEVFTKSNGLLSDQFNYKSGLKASDGKLYFGSLNGFIVFDPKTFSKSSFEPKVTFTGLKLFNKEIIVGASDGILSHSITQTNKIVLTHDQSSLSLSFAALGFTQPESWKYLYKLEGFEKEWNQPVKSNEVSYPNLAPGNYTLLVKTINEQGEISQEEANLSIVIKPPFYYSPLAYFIYFLLLMILIISIILSYRKRVQNRHQKNIEILEAQKEKEIFNAKIEFFTNITHEIRTPLTLIKGPLEIILKNEEKLEDNTKENLKIMEKNADRLIHLSNQLLDFRKAEKQSFQLNFVKTDISRVLIDLHYRFQPLAYSNQLKFEVTGIQDVYFADVDQEELIKIVSNMVSNAIKYAASYINIALVTEEDTNFEIVVSNDGKLIDESYQEKIFEPFFQIDPDETNKPRQGTGLGLPLAKSLAELHGGNLSYSATYINELNSFILKLPKNQSHSFELDKIESEEFFDADDANFPNTSIKNAIEKQVILLVEDNRELQTFIETNLKNDYHILKANHGKDALRILEAHQVDLIISDIMMPVMDGITMCHQLKSDLLYSHIPVILLTAKNNIQSKLEGLEVGADVYIEKPFSVEYLILQAKNLLKYRDQVRDNFAKSPQVLSVSIAHTKADEKFLHEINKIIDAEISNEQFGVNELAEKVHMSQSSLLRKIKGVSKLTPNEYIRLVRLKKAAELLSSGSLSISEVCVKVGFNSPSYFSKCFQKQFGELPKDYQK
ncbi:two-component regulator propeller domain-containing protein [Belliella kenyensis]|uniref:histidine kinase n=1 Tax=Belliella kenyensis TaxID=1472724 RepID=A0ABV8EKZ9_9BACT|nr:hybrid sensor histidine kinase/response regulator transcription factor [Belliella kenyensis]MCH7403039.1 response regulator [Belliella kenyensis]MDN3605076.1 two-component regulator propeller domain-containing protein [Belliella kenyensis]